MAMLEKLTGIHTKHNKQRTSIGHFQTYKHKQHTHTHTHTHTRTYTHVHTCATS